MSEFDELLDGVLSEDANPEMPVGMERRIRSALSVAMERRPRQRFLREAIAAVVLLGVAGVLTVRHRTTTVRVAGPDEFGIAAAGRIAAAPVTVVPAGKEHGRSPVVVGRVRRTLSRPVVALSSLTIASLTIEPIEVASLPDSSTERSNLQESKEAGAQ